MSPTMLFVIIFDGVREMACTIAECDYKSWFDGSMSVADSPHPDNILIGGCTQTLPLRHEGYSDFGEFLNRNGSLFWGRYDSADREQCAKQAVHSSIPWSMIRPRPP